MSILRKKTVWQRAMKPLTSPDKRRGAVKSGVTTAVTALGVTAASAVVSAVRRREGSR